ncbi:ATP-binding cassette domain-containing protein [Sphingobacterium sp. HJSM2_6]|uniref:ATP-binding cassette domain-containing protein n=1 Tax=Sphingobacterium sp. HJSM2_6 TaxID=3366264 RepID=UPI003BE0CC40
MNYSLKYQLHWAWKISHNYHVQLFLYFILELLCILSSLLFVYYSKNAIDVAIKSTDGQLQEQLIFVVLSMLFSLLFKTLASVISQRSQLKFVVSLQNMVLSKQLHAVWTSFYQRETGDLMVRMNADVNEVVQMISQVSISAVLTVIKILASFGMLWFLDPILAVIILAICPLIILSKYYYKKLRIITKKVRTFEGRVANGIQENFRDRLLIKSLGLIDSYINKFEKLQQEILTIKTKQLRLTIYSQTLVKLTLSIGYLIAFVWGVMRLSNQDISFGTLTAFIQLVNRIQNPMMGLLGFLPSFIRFRTSADRLIEVFESEQENQNELTVINPNSIHFDHVGFNYKNQIVLENINIDIQKGDVLAIVGPSGKGKTTMLRLLLHLLKPSSGKIVIKDESNNEIAIGNQTKMNFAYVPQGNSLFAGTIKENLVKPGQIVSEDQLNEAIQLASADFIYGLPNGIYTKVGEGGFGVSEGQAQRIAIARAMLLDYDLWLFDEATSALDRETSKQIFENLLSKGQGKILIFVTHDLELANKCHYIVNLK